MKMEMKINGALPSSFRDTSGFVYFQDGTLFRQVNRSYKDHYDHLLDSGLYRALTNDQLMVSHVEANPPLGHAAMAYKILQPEEVPFISYPYEWCFSQLKRAALTTLKIQKVALEFGMSLKDASAYNIQFLKNKPIFIDTLSFEKYQEGRPWVAYRQFCQHFLAPLSLMNFRDSRLNQLLRVNLDGIPLDLASSILPSYTYLKFGILSHIHLHAKTQKYYAGKEIAINECKMGRKRLLHFIENLESTVRKMKYQVKTTQWGDYYENTNYSDVAQQNKKELLSDYLKKSNPKNVWDLGANDGTFSRIASEKGILTIAFDMDHAAVEKNYRECLKRKDHHILPLVMDLTNPSGSSGWGNQERMSLGERGPVDAILALALIHHLAISNNLPLIRVAEFFAALCNWLIIEFVPKSDSQVKRLLSTREDIFQNYTRQAVEDDFSQYFTIQACSPIEDSDRTLYLFHNKNYHYSVD